MPPLSRTARAALPALAATATLATVGPALGITSTGYVDGNRHPAVGAMLTAADGGGYYAVCTVTLVAPKVVVTASHCTAYVAADPAADFVTFDGDLTDGVSGVIPATPVTNPRYSVNSKDDVSVMLLDRRPSSSIAPMGLPPLGYLNRVPLTQRTRLTVVGYGSQEKTRLVGGGWYYPDLGVRAYAIGGFSSLTPDWLKMSQVASRGDSGACYGDSGGPTFLGSGSQEGSIVVAVTSSGDTPCYASNVAARTDTPSARAFLSQYVP